MKRLISMILMLCLLWGCADAGPSDPTGSLVPPVGDTAQIAYPQTGRYQETALLADVPGQGWPRLLDVRLDGTVDYLFSASEQMDPRGHFSEDGLQYYTISPTGSYTRQETPWIGELEQYLTRVWTEAGVPDACWQYAFASRNGVLLIVAQLEDRSSAAAEGVLCSALFKVERGAMTMIPMDWTVETDRGVLSIDREYIGGMRFDGETVTLELVWGIAAIDDYFTAEYAMNGELVALREQELYPIEQSDGSILYSTVPDGKPVTIDDEESLYLLGSPWVWRRANAMSADGIYYFWMQHFDQGILMQYTPNPAGKIEPEELTVWSMEPIDAIQAAVCQWNHTHASPIFRYETAESEEDLTRLNLQLANGQGPDVLILDGMNAADYLDFMAPLDGLDTTGVYENLLEPFTVNGELLAMPTRMQPWLLGRTASGTEEIESLSAFAELVTTATGVLDLSADFGNAYRYYDALYNATFAEDVFDQWYPAWQDTIFDGGVFRADAFREFLTQTKRLVDHYSLGTLAEAGLESRDFSNATDDSPFGNTAKRPFPYTLAATNYVGLYSYWWMHSTDAQEPPDPIPCILSGIPGPDGTGVAVPRHIAAVRAGGAEAAGIEFVQSLLEDRMQMGGQYYHSSSADGYPVKWNVTEHLLELREGYMNQQFQVENDFRATLEALQAVAILDYPYEVCLEAALGYYTGELSLDEAVNRVQSETALYLAESRR